MTRTLSSPNAGSTVVDRLRIHEGGTGAVAASEAATLLNAIRQNQVGAPGGIAGLDASGRLTGNVLPDSGLATVNVTGPVAVTVGLTAEYTISNFDTFTTYTVSAIRGSVYMVGKRIVYTAPVAVGDGSGGFILNGRAFNVVIDVARPQTPTVTATSMVGSAVNSAVVVGNGSAFAMTTGTGAHLNTDWQVSTDLAFSNIVSQSLANSSNRVSWVSSNLNRSTLYHIRSRYRDSNNLVSEWSPTVSVTTRATFIPNVEQAKLIANDRVSGDQFGWSVSMTDDGSRVVIAAINDDSITGSAYVYVRSGTTWTQEAKLTASDRVIGDEFGRSVAISGDGTRVITGARLADVSSVANTGAAYVYVRSGTTWTQEAKLTASDRLANDLFGWSVSISLDGTRVAVGARDVAISAVARVGSVYVYVRSGTTWTQEAKLTASDRAAGDELGISVSISSDSIRIIAGAYGADISSVAETGAAYVFVRSGTTWTQEAKLIASDRATGDQLGQGVSINSDGSRVAIGAHRANISAVSDTGAVYIFVRSGTTWTQEAKLIANDRLAEDVLGHSVSISLDGTTVAVGAHGIDASGLTNTGGVYLFSRSGTTWTQDARIITSDRAAGDQFGVSVALSGDSSYFVSGSFTSDVNGAGDTGAAYIFST